MKRLRKQNRMQKKVVEGLKTENLRTPKLYL